MAKRGIEASTGVDLPYAMNLSTGEAWRRDPRPLDGISRRRLRRARSGGRGFSQLSSGEAAARNW